MLTHVEYLVEDFLDWLTTVSQRPDRDNELPADGNLAETIAIWMQDRGAAKAANHEAFLRAVVLITATADKIRFRPPDHDHEVTVVTPDDAAGWWMLDAVEFESGRITSAGPRR